MTDHNNSLVLITGASGLLGRNLLEMLVEKGLRVRAVYHNNPISFSDSDLIEIVQCDLLDVIALDEVMKDVTHVYHCAGLVSFSPKNVERLYKVNMEATANMVNASLRFGVKKFIHVSSVATLSHSKEKEMIDEEMKPVTEKQNGAYGYSKYLGELEVWRGIAEGLDAAIVNPSIILGPSDRDNGSSAIFKNVYDGFNWYSEGINGFVGVKDVCKAMIMLMESEVSADRFVISAENLSYRDVFFMIADTFGKKRPTKKVTPFLAQLVWRLEAIKSLFSKTEPLVTKDTASTALEVSMYDNQKFKKSFPQYEYEPIKSIIESSCKAFQQKLNNS